MNVYKYLLRVLIAPLAIALVAFPVWGADANPQEQSGGARQEAPAPVNKPAWGTIAGIARTPAGQPLGSAMITAVRQDGTGIRATISGSDGIYSFADVAPGQYSVTMQADGYADHDGLPIQVTAGRATRLDITAGTSAALPATISANAPAQQAVPASAGTQPPSQPTTAAAAGSVTPNGIFLNRWLSNIDKAYAAKAAKSSSAAKTPDSAQVASLGTPPIAALDRPAPDAPSPQADPPAATTTAAKTVSVLPDPLSAPDPPPPGIDYSTPFAYGDFSWLNGSPRNNPVLDTKFFTPEIRFDTHYMEDLNQPVDHTIGGSTESFRSGEFQVEQISVGGDFHYDNVRGRILTMDGLFATTTPRNDASAAVGQWDLRDAYKYVSEAWGGYHFDVGHGLNVDAGIFVSYIGLFSYYNFDNWTYQPSFVSSNTPWFFNGVRIQWFPTNKLKIEPWIINGWQSYAKFNGHRGLGGQILWQPNENTKFVFNNYGNGTDALGVPGRSRLHTDDSVEYRYYHKPGSTGVTQMAFSFTVDAGCEYGGVPGVNYVTCHGGKAGPKQSFLGWMLYDRVWWGKDKYAVTVGGGQMNNPGRYLTLLPPINGADAISGSPYFTGNPGDTSKMWDTTTTFQWMPKQYITWWIEGGYRNSNVPYWTGRGGITPPGGNTGSPSQYVCAAGGSAGTSDLATAESNCGGGMSSVWFPDLRKTQTTFSIGVLVKF
jgi:hypothetical protein